jgi:YrbI family 3-deoxy-D-manno-octulosonate 8-phosphate phosphatase
MKVDPSSEDFASRARKVKFLGLDFDGVMTDNTVYVFEDGREAVRCSRLEGFGLRRVEEAGIEPMIISTEPNVAVGARARKLKIGCIQNVDDKVAAMGRLLSERGLSWEQAAFIGNDINDKGVLEKVVLPVLVADAHESVLHLKAFRTARYGGAGAVRELCDAIANVLGKGAR